MRKNNEIVLLILWLLLPTCLNAQTDLPTFDHLFHPERHYIIHKTDNEIDVDGVAAEKSWQDANWTENFMDIEGPSKPLPTYQTRMKMLWDEKNIYFFVEMEEPHVWGYYEEHDKIVYHENDFEIFIDPDGDTHNYFEFEFNAQNTLFDLFMTKPYRNGGIPLISWSPRGIKSAVSIDGTLNNPNDKDKNWTLEVAIPFKDLRIGVHTRAPENGNIWRINFSRVQWQTKISDDKYKRKKNEETGRLIRENNWVWSSIGIVNMHYPERWGFLQFSEKLPGAPVNFTEPEDKKLRNHLWRIYYKQYHYRHKKGNFTESLDLLSENEFIKIDENRTLQVNLYANNYQFTIIAKTNDGITLTLNNNGRISTYKNQ